jgi:hypothetical protein
MAGVGFERGEQMQPCVVRHPPSRGAAASSRLLRDSKSASHGRMHVYDRISLCVSDVVWNAGVE